MKTYDWIVVGAGVTGSALSYELAKAGFSVLLLDQETNPQNATRFSYGGVAYWAANTDLMRQICQEGLEIYRNLSAELAADTQFRMGDLLLTVDAGRDPEAIAPLYADCLVPPQRVSVTTACEIEPLLNREAIAAALHVKHGQVNPELTAQAYREAFFRLGGMAHIAQVKEFLRVGDRITGVSTPQGDYSAAQVVICAGGLSRALLQANGLPRRIYFTQAELIETPPLEVQLQTFIAPAEQRRFSLEAMAGSAEMDALWDSPGHEVAPAILDAGAFQFQDGRIRIGQISRVLTDPGATGDAVQSETEMREGVGRIIPALKNVPGQWRTCLVGFSGDRLPLIGALPGVEGIYLFSGFSNPFASFPALARRFARHLAGQQDDEAILQCSPSRFLDA